ncbi:MAG: primosomal protein N' [Spirochaetaceae bacterium]|jgi:primosomal protein N' (replication factor Y)|nr:primosomal protein N' [Spirochaetaceae bacterium]
MMRYFEVLFDIPVDSPFTYSCDDAGAGTGKRAACPFGKREMVGYITAEISGVPAFDIAKIKNIRRIVDKEPVFGDEEIALARWLADYYFCSHGQALSAMIPGGRRVIEFSALGNSDLEKDIVEHKVYDLSGEQKDALDAILDDTGDTSDKSDKSNKTNMFYLYGITGSGKTEVFLKTAESVLNAGKSVIYLVPEIALTQQTACAITKRFGNIAATFHSAMKTQEKFNQWLGIKRGDVRIVVGPRSAVFAPVKNLGLIIIDEEHDGSYKSGNTPRYHGRQVAIKRCILSGAKLVMGSATPSVEAWKLMNDGVIKRLALTKRLAGGAMPEIKPVSLLGQDGCLTFELKQEIRKTAQMGRQTILFLNRRGFSYYYNCPSCGYEFKCPHCSVSLTWHKSKGRAQCHYCGYQTQPPKVCPKCGSLEAGFMGAGTEMIEEEVVRTFPDLRVRRVDTDIIKSKLELENTIEMFRSGLIDILLGTQMIAKGLNFPGVRLVGLVFADIGLQMPDFRAYERVFSLIVQVAGRAGRFFPDGKVLLQTLRPKDPLILRACALDMQGFYETELEQRRLMDFPPYTRLIRLSIRSRDAKAADTAIERLAGFIAPLIPRTADILGPAECPIEMIAGSHRRHIIVRGASMAVLHGAVRSALALYDQKKDSKVYLEIDVDPVNVM